MALYQHGLAAALGVFMIVIGVVIPKLIEWQVRDSIRSSLSVDSVSDSGYNDWVQSKTGDIYRKFLGYELNNPLAFLGGAAPNFTEWSLDDEVWYTWQRTNNNANFSADRTQVTTNTYSVYTMRSDSPGSDQKYLLTVNWAFATLVSGAGSEQALWTVFADVMLGRMLQTNAALWAYTGTTYCYLGTICGLRKYATDTGTTVPTFSATQLGQIGALIPTTSWVGEYLTIVPAIYNSNTSAPARTAYINAANVKFPFFDFNNYATDSDPLRFAGYLNYLTTATATTVNAVYGTTPYGLFFKNATIHDHVFGIDPLLALLGLGTSVINNGSHYINVIKTGYGNDFYLGMDYYTTANSIQNNTKYPMGNFSVAGRQASIPPFQPRPDTFEIFFPTALRFVTAKYVADSNVKGLPTWYFAFDTDLLLAVNPDFGVKVRGIADLSYISSGAPIWASMPRLANVDPAWASRISGIPAATSAGDSFLNIEGVTGVGVEGSAQLLFSCYVNFTKTPFLNFAAARANHEFILPMFQAVDYRVIADSKVGDLHKAVVWAPRVQKIIRFVLVIVGCVLVGLAILTYVYVLWSGRDGEQAGEQEAMEGIKSTDTDMGATQGELAPNPLDTNDEKHDAVMPRATATELN